MDYGQIYSDLIERGLTRTFGDGVYLEKHHVWPKCMGGPDEESNLVKLTPEEHYLAHQLLVKMFPDNRKLLYAAMMMCGNTSKQKRYNNKAYGWLRRKISENNKGNKHNLGRTVTKETRRKIGEANKGRIMSKEARLKMSEAKKGNTPWNKGKKGQVAWNKGKGRISECKEEIKERYFNGETQKSLALYFKLSPSVISNIVKGKY